MFNILSYLNSLYPMYALIKVISKSEKCYKKNNFKI